MRITEGPRSSLKMVMLHGVTPHMALERELSLPVTTMPAVRSAQASSHPPPTVTPCLPKGHDVYMSY